MRIEGKETPALDNKPDLPEYLIYYFDAFKELSLTRGVTLVGLLPITWSEISAYLSAFPTWDAESFGHHIRVMDLAYLELKMDQNGG